MAFCSRCGNEIISPAYFCPNCGNSTNPMAAPQPPYSHATINNYYYKMNDSSERPISITIIAVLSFFYIFNLFDCNNAFEFFSGILGPIICVGLWKMKKWGAYLNLASLAIAALYMFFFPDPELRMLGRETATAVRLIGTLSILIEVYFIRKHLSRMT